jgi:hypothetical protein
MQGTGQNAATGEPRLAQLLTAFTFASDLAFGLEFEDGIKSAYLAVRIAEKMGLSEEDRLVVYYTAMLKDAGCTCFTSQWADFLQTANEIEARREAIVFGGLRPENAASWMDRYAGNDLPALGRASHLAYVAMNGAQMVAEAWAASVEVCSRIATRLGMPAAVQKATNCLGEQWDGEGFPNRLKGDAIPIASLIVSPTLVLPPLHRVAGGPCLAGRSHGT